MSTPHIWLTVFGPAVALIAPARTEIKLFPLTWTLEEAVVKAVHLREEMSRLLVGWEFSSAELLSSKETGSCLSVSWTGMSQSREALFSDEEIERLQTLFPPKQG